MPCNLLIYFYLGAVVIVGVLAYGIYKGFTK